MGKAGRRHLHYTPVRSMCEQRLLGTLYHVYDLQMLKERLEHSEKQMTSFQVATIVNATYVCTAGGGGFSLSHFHHPSFLAALPLVFCPLHLVR